MLLEFYVENFRSIKRPTTLSLLADQALSEYRENLIRFRKELVLPEVMILGPNGSGKTNILRAISTAVQILKQSASITPGEQIQQVIPFAFSSEQKEKPTTFEFNFTIDDLRYIYGYSITDKYVTEEFLYKYITESKSVIFERDFQEFYYPKKMKQFKLYETLITKNRLFLSLGAQLNDPECSKVYEYLTTSFSTFNPRLLSAAGEKIILENKLDGLKNRMLDLLQRADFSIDDFEIKTKDYKFEDLLRKNSFEVEDFSEELLEQPYRTDNESETTHTVFGDKYKLLLSEESDGTQNYFYLLPIFLKALEEGTVLLLDELDDSLHPLLVAELAALFNDPEMNPHHAQLIFTTHDVLLLSMDNLRRDQIYFVEKTIDQQDTDLYSLADFSTKKGENRIRNYLVGRYGAIPRILEGKLDDQ